LPSLLYLECYNFRDDKLPASNNEKKVQKLH